VLVDSPFSSFPFFPLRIDAAVVSFLFFPPYAVRHYEYISIMASPLQPFDADTHFFPASCFGAATDVLHFFGHGESSDRHHMAPHRKALLFSFLSFLSARKSTCKLHPLPPSLPLPLTRGMLGKSVHGSFKGGPRATLFSFFSPSQQTFPGGSFPRQEPALQCTLSSGLQ